MVEQSMLLRPSPANCLRTWITCSSKLSSENSGGPVRKQGEVELEQGSAHVDRAMRMAALESHVVAVQSTCWVLKIRGT